ncbi:Ig-like domain-containing domain [Hymenobacter qilianensis]|uniref:Ig-like domain-containing protein n=1 Tax=Hymenobacter qilianensis TaxID=1385715 RepID=A0A7H0GYJ1_9BACT|nr:Ig-like domain-containing domain [Hymenobacter qilianensis]QNP53357.1 Ig-like domain-containing protein [Hymenobacter qilianensis]
MSVRAHLLFLLGIGIGMSGCAAVSSPEGGPKDLTPPKLVRTSPEQGARNVTQRSIRLEFSETVQLKDLQKNLIIAPVISEENKYQVREDKGGVTLTFEQPLDKNTTYSFNFGKAITDITENNEAPNVMLSFSTGADLDSGRVFGRVTDLLTKRTAEDISVILYPEADTANIRRGRPYYLARTTKNGQYSFQNLREGRYRLFALQDKNNTRRYEEGERIAYLPELITVAPGLDSIALVLVRPDARRPLATGRQGTPTQFKVSYNEGVRQAVLAPLPGGGATSPEAVAQLNSALQVADQGKSVVLYKTKAVAEGRYLLSATDSVGNVGRDTINVRFQGNAPARRGPAYTVEGSPQEVYYQGQVQFVFTEPVILPPNKPFGTLVEDSTARRPLRLPQDGTLSPDRVRLTVKPNFKARKTATIILDSTAITSVTGQSLGLRPLRLRISEQSPSGTLSGAIQTKFTRYQIQLINDTFQPVAVLDSPKNRYIFTNIAPGSYQIRVLIDADANGTWYGGDPQFRLPAEPVYIFPKKLDVRANWEQEENIAF